jgi:Mor family transcriptional regulator
MQKNSKFSFLTPDDVRAIRAEYELDYTGNAITAVNVIELAKRYGVSQQTIRNIANRKRYAWVND